MENNIKKVILILLFSIININAEINKVDKLLEQVKQSTSNNEKTMLLQELKQELFKINKKTREDASAIINAKKKIPSQSFKPKKSVK